MPRPSNTTERRTQIVQGLRRVMAERGYERASITAIAKAAGLAPGLVHYHFHTKQEILLALVEDLAEGWRQRLRSRSRIEPTNPRRELHTFIDAFLALGEGADPEAVACWVTIGAEAVHQPEVREAYEEVVRQMLDELDDLLKRASPKSSGKETQHLAAAILAHIEGSYRLACAAPGSTPEGFAAPTLRLLIDAVLDRSPGTAP